MKAQTPNETQGQTANKILEAPERWGVKLRPRLTAIPLSDGTARLIEIYQLTLCVAELYGNRQEVYLREHLDAENSDIQDAIEKQYIEYNERALKALNPFLQLVTRELQDLMLEYIDCPYKENAEA